MIFLAALSHHLQLLSAVTMATLPLAWWLGRPPERAIGCVITAIIVPSLVLQTFHLGWFSSTSLCPDCALRDGLLLISLTAIALRANRFYPMVMTGAALVAVLAHLMRWLGLFDGQFSYLVLTSAPAYVMIAAFWAGLVLHIKRERLVGAYPSWRDQSATQMIAAASEIGYPAG